VFNAVANSGAFKLMGGGDSEAAASLLGLTEKFDWISTGGGAMLEFLAKGTLPGIEALK
jgi:phosphoglycerate kinase